MGGEFMYTALATITDVIVDGCNIWIQICYDNRVFPAHHELNAGRLIDYERIAFLLKITKSKKIDELKGKTIRIIDNEQRERFLIAIGSDKKNKFIELYSTLNPTTEKGIYRRERVRSLVKEKKQDIAKRISKLF